MNKDKGFVLLEILMVVFFIAIVLSILFMVTNPIVHWKKDYDFENYENILSISNAIMASKVYNQGQNNAYLEQLPIEQAYIIGNQYNNESCLRDVSGYVDLTYLIDEGHLTSLPVIFSVNNIWDDSTTGYYLYKNKENTLTIGSCESQTGKFIEVTR